MKILQVNDYRETIGGAEMYIDRISTHLKQNGHMVDYLTSDTSAKEYYQNLVSPAWSVHMRRIFSYTYMRRMQQRIKEFQPDVIHIHGILQELTPSIVLATSNIPMIMTVHDLQIVQAVSRPEDRNGKPCAQKICPGCRNCVGWKGAIYQHCKRSLHKSLWKRIKLFVSPSEFTRQSISKLIPLSQSRHLPNGIPLLKPTSISSTNQLLYIGRISKDKGLKMLIDICNYVNDKQPYQLVIAGSGPDQEYLDSLINKSAYKERIKLMGKVPYEKITSLYSQSTVVIVPSDYPDNLPTVCMEAMSAGRPVIATRVGGIPEMVLDGQTGFLVNQDDARTAAEKILELTSNEKKLQKFSRQASQHAKQFDIDRHMHELEKIYQSIAIDN